MKRIKQFTHQAQWVVLAVVYSICISFSTLPKQAQAAELDLEPRLAQIFEEIKHSRLDAALRQTDAILQAYPHFQLAYLIRGDLLLARTRPLKSFGDAPNAPLGKVTDLREEAIVRLKAYQAKPPENHFPRSLLLMSPQQKYALIIDIQKSRLYLYENTPDRPQFVADYYISYGKAGVNKRYEGDQKTPLGVYHVTSSLPKKTLSDFYGTNAFPLNYPNEWDKRLGNSGHGIWLHGTPNNIFSRPPRASDGCIVLSNINLNAITKILQIGVTPVIIGNNIEWVHLNAWQAERTLLQAGLETWRADWQSLNTEKYLRHYSKTFSSNGENYAKWVAHKQRVSAGKQWSKIELSNISILRDPDRQDLVVISFDQNYRSNNLSNQMKKRQYWLKENGVWKITYEGAA